MKNVRLIWVTPDAEKIIGYCARVSSPQNQDNPNVSKLLAYCIKNRHWSIFEMANMCVEVETSVPIATQILRHKLSAQQFSARYSEVQGFQPVTPRRQDEKNRQNSFDDLPDETKEWFESGLKLIEEQSIQFYKESLEKGVAKECARFALPQAASTRMYLNGTIRNWIHYLEVRTGNGTQLEHQQVANGIKEIFVDFFPQISEAMGWIKN